MHLPEGLFKLGCHAAATQYKFLEALPRERSQELFLKGTAIRAYHIWQERFVENRSPAVIATDRALPVEAIYETLDNCAHEWELIVAELQADARAAATR